jgi:proton-dependent oligopeptide transporter, POT family
LREQFVDAMPTSTTTNSSSSSSSSIFTNPVVLSILITETSERFAYFGFRAILVLFFVHGLQYSESTAVSLCSAQLALSFCSPLLGALLADGSWGRYLTILRFGIIYAIGLIMLAVAAYQVTEVEGAGEISVEQDGDTVATDGDGTSSTKLSMLRGLTFLGLLGSSTGVGGIKPCVSAFGADQVVVDEEAESKKSENDTIFEDEPSQEDLSRRPSESPTESSSSSAQQSSMTRIREERIREFFSSFYFCINVGAVCSFAVIPIVRAHFGFGEAFLVPALFMIFALTIFWSQRKRYKYSNMEDSTLTETFQACMVIVMEQMGRIPRLRQCMASLGIRRFGGHDLVSTLSDEDGRLMNDPSTHALSGSLKNQEVMQDAAQALHVMPILFMFPIFWMLYDQQGSVWTLQASRMSLHGLQPEQLNVLNPIGILLFIPLFDRIVYPMLEERGYNLKPLVRIQYGMLLASFSFLTSAVLEYYMENQYIGTVHVAWQVPQITILTVAEILLSVTGLEFAYAQAPKNTQALILSLYFFMMAIGDGLGALLYASVFSTWRLASAMLMCSALMLVNFVIFAFVAKKWRPYVRDLGPSRTLELQSMIDQH